MTAATARAGIPAAIALRAPRPGDARAIHALAGAAPGIDRNSPYAYMLVCSHFAGTSLVAASGGRIVGYLAAYRPPSRPDALFVWQVAVAEEARGRGVARAMILRALDRPAARDAVFLESTVTPSNTASRALFESAARARRAPFRWGGGFRGADLGGGHEDEILFRAGPLGEPT